MLSRIRKHSSIASGSWNWNGGRGLKEVELNMAMAWAKGSAIGDQNQLLSPWDLSLAPC